MDGLSSDITRFLHELSVSACNLQDLSPLSGCDHSLLEVLDLSSNLSLSDISPLRGPDLSSLKCLYISYTGVSDISPLCGCKGLSPEYVSSGFSAMEDLSPLSVIDVSSLKRAGLKEPIDVRHTKVSDLSPLDNISNDGVFVSL